MTTTEKKRKPRSAGKEVGDIQELFETPEWCVSKLAIPILKRSFEGEAMPTVFEPAAGHGAISRVLEKEGYSVISRDLFTLPEKHDFLDKSLPLPEFDVLVTNPPFRLKKLFLQRAMELEKPFLMLVPLEIICRGYFQEALRHGLTYSMYPVSPRPRFLRNSTSQSIVDCVWIFGGKLDKLKSVDGENTCVHISDLK